MSKEKEAAIVLLNALKDYTLMFVQDRDNFIFQINIIMMIVIDPKKYHKSYYDFAKQYLKPIGNSFETEKLIVKDPWVEKVVDDVLELVNKYGYD